MRFVDTGILLYAISSDPQEIIAAERAAEVLSARDLAFSVAVFEEFFQLAVSGGADSIDADTSMALLETLRRFPVQESSLAWLDATVAAARRWQLTHRDAGVIEAARLQGCHEVLSTVLPAGAEYAGVRVTNPLA